MVEGEVEVVLLSLELAGGGVLLPLAVGAGVAGVLWLAPLAAAELESDAEAAWDWAGVAALEGAGLCGGLGGCAVGAGAAAGVGAGVLASSKSANDCVSVPCTIVDICCHCDDGIEGVAPTSDAILDTCEIP